MRRSGGGLSARASFDRIHRSPVVSRGFRARPHHQLCRRFITDHQMEAETSSTTRNNTPANWSLLCAANALRTYDWRRQRLQRFTRIKFF